MSLSLKRLHHTSGIVLASFLLLHIGNHLFALGGPQWHITVMNILRHIYRFWLVELVLLFCVGFQVVSGVSFVVRKGFVRQPFYVVVQVLSGLYLSFFMIYHVQAVLRGRLQWKMNTDFYFAAGVANHYPEKLFFIPYYTLSLVAVFAHIAAAHYIKRMEQRPDQHLLRRYKNETLGICLVGSVVTFLIMIAFTGVLYKI
ncbi:hypothetical protein HHL17_18330 [Chitinophaga sp. G-6-1-13]|uniref:Uncharacterized protein n=1 Tax=Chitinophaga fulva TaxID=2728842 RepID=A0A848GQW9_9BACT|nr:hypothetical protein [Chitinophaga fulva]NML39163.1 hypothetical protein [Chitinophaga fulva]